jgi:GcrA cell cycle regulator
MGWTDERVELLRKLWAEGLSAGQIAERLAVTRNAIIGKVHRLGLAPRRGPQYRMSSHGLPRGRRPDRPYPRRSAAALNPCPVVTAAPVPQLAFDVLGPLGLGVLDLLENSCRWPFGDPKRDFGGFCGREADGSYCDDHARLAYRPATRRGRR